MTELAALNVKINGDSADLQSDIAKAKAQLQGFDTQVNKAQAGTTRFSGGLSRLGNVSGSTRAKIQNTSFQLQDIAVQLQGGTRASTVFAQQLPQLLSGFGALGAVAGVLAGVGIPALAFAFANVRSEVRTLGDTLEELGQITNDINAATEILKMDALELGEKYGLLAQRVRELAREELILREQRAVNFLQEQIESLGDLSTAYAGALKSGYDYRRAMERIQRDFGLTGQSAKNLASALNSVSEARTPEEQVAAMNELRRILEENNIELSAIPDELQEAILKANGLEQAMINAAAAISNAAAEADGLAAALPMSAGNQFGFAGSLEAGLLPPEPSPDPKRPGRARTNPLIAQLENVQNALMTQEEMQIASFERQQETLNAALEQRLLTQKEYNDLMEQAQSQHADRMAQIDVYRYGSTLQKTGKFLGDMANALQNGNEKMLKIAKVFSAAQAVINAYEAYTDVLANQPGELFAKLAAGAAVLSAGLGAVSAIKGVTSGGGGVAPVGGLTAPTAAAAAAAPAVSRNVAISLQGGDIFSRDQVINLINSINEAVEDGAIVRLV